MCYYVYFFKEKKRKEKEVSLDKADRESVLYKKNVLKRLTFIN